MAPVREWKNNFDYIKFCSY